MEEYRVDFLTKDEMFISEKRTKRPVSFVNPSTKDFENLSKGNCPFCETRQEELGSIIIENKKVRVVENVYPGISDKYGKHEVLIESYEHSKKFEDLDDEYSFHVLKTLQIRYNSLIKDYDFINIFKNEGVLSGASLYHTHWQIIALNKVAPKNKVIYNSFCEFLEKNGHNFFDTSFDSLTLYEGEYFKIVAPLASKFSYMLRVVPLKHISSFKEFDDNELFELGILLKKILLAYKNELGDISYNFNLQDFYNRKEGCFFFEVLPRFVKFGGFELLTNAFLTSGSGEKTFEVLKKYF